MKKKSEKSEGNASTWLNAFMKTPPQYCELHNVVNV